MKHTYVKRPKNVIISFESMTWLDRMDRARDDDNVSFDQYYDLAKEFADYLFTLSDEERQETSMRLIDMENAANGRFVGRVKGIGRIEL